MDEPISFFDQLDQVGQQIATAIQNSELQIYAILAVIVVAALFAFPPKVEQSPADWRAFEVPDFGTRIQYPASVFTPAGQPEMGIGQRFERAD